MAAADPQENHVALVSFQMKSKSVQASVPKHIIQTPVTLSKLAALKIPGVTGCAFYMLIALVPNTSRGPSLGPRMPGGRRREGAACGLVAWIPW